MKNLASLLSALQILEPDVDPYTVKITMLEQYDDLNKVTHLHPTYLTHLPTAALPGLEVVEVTIGSLEQNPCLITCAKLFEGNEICFSIVDPELRDAAAELETWDNIRPLQDNDPAVIIEDIDSVEKLVMLGYEFERYDAFFYESMSESCTYEHPHRYDSTLNEAHRRVVNEMEALKAGTISSSKALDLLAAAAARDHGIVRDEAVVRVVLATDLPLRQFGSTADQNLVDLSRTARLVYQEPNDTYSAALVELPLWVGQLIATCTPTSIGSSFYPKDTTDPVVFDTAKTLWSEARDGVLANFDHAFEAATRLLHV